MPPDRAESAPLSRRHGMLILFAAAALLICYFWLSQLQLFVLSRERRGPPELVYAICFAAALLMLVVPPARARAALLLVSILGCGAQLGVQSLTIFAFAAVVIAVSRLKGPILPRAGLLLAIWIGALLPKFWMTHPEYVELRAFYFCWAGFPFAAVYLVVERARGALQDSSWLDDALYLLALPRFVTPFYQPISPAKFLASRQVRPNLQLALRGLGLGLYGAALQVVIAKVPFVMPLAGDPFMLEQESSWIWPGRNLLVAYALNAANIFCAIGFFRILGFDLGSGFRWPLASRSMADFFRRWNYYIYEGVRSLFFFPIAARLRRWLPPTATAIVSGYSAIFLGAFCLNHLLAPFAIAPDPLQHFAHIARPETALVFGLYWTSIIIPQLALRRLHRAPPGRARRVLQHLLFFVVLTLLARVARFAGVPPI